MTNHMMYLDLSMADNMRFTLIQLFNLIYFCQRVKILSNLALQIIYKYTK